MHRRSPLESGWEPILVLILTLLASCALVWVGVHAPGTTLAGLVVAVAIGAAWSRHRRRRGTPPAPNAAEA